MFGQCFHTEVVTSTCYPVNTVFLDRTQTIKRVLHSDVLKKIVKNHPWALMDEADRLIYFTVHRTPTTRN